MAELLGDRSLYVRRDDKHGGCRLGNPTGRDVIVSCRAKGLDGVAPAAPSP
jgi:hypothetical protein